MEYVAVLAGAVSAWGFVCAIIVPFKFDDESVQVATFQRFLMIGGFYGWVGLHLGGLA